MSVESVIEFHHTIVALIVVIAALTAGAKVIAIKHNWRDGQEYRRVFAILVCIFEIVLNSLRYVGRIDYDPAALALGAVGIIGLLLVVMWFAVSEW